MPTTDSETTAASTISVATMSTIAIDLDARTAVLPRQARPTRTGGFAGESSSR